MSFKDVQIAFAGHNRPEDIDNLDAARASLASAFERLKSAGLVSGTLITGVADGADLLAAAAWDSAGLGPVHAVYPYLNDAPAEITATHGRTDTWLDGDSFDTAGRSAHLALTRWLVESADLLLVVWSGEAARGPGGTADAVSVALQRGVPVLWIRPPDYDGLYLITPPDPDDDISFNEFLQQIESGSVPVAEAAAAGRIAHQLKMRGFDRHSPFDRAEAPRPNRLLRWLDDIAHRTVWRTYALFHNLAGGTREKPAPAPSAPADLANQPGFEILSRAYARADALAIRLSTTVPLVRRSGGDGCRVISCDLGGKPPARRPDRTRPRRHGRAGLVRKRARPPSRAMERCAQTGGTASAGTRRLGGRPDRDRSARVGHHGTRRLSGAGLAPPSRPGGRPLRP